MSLLLCVYLTTPGLRHLSYQEAATKGADELRKRRQELGAGQARVEAEARKVRMHDSWCARRTVERRGFMPVFCKGKGTCPRRLTAELG